MASRAGSFVVIGIGNRERGDDAAGPLLLDRLRDAATGAGLVESAGDPAAIVAAVDRVGAVVFVDACISGAAPGTVHRFDLNRGKLPPMRSGLSSHGFGLGEAVELARVLGTLPPVCIVYAIEGACFEPGRGLSRPVARAIPTLAERIRDEIAAWTHAQRGCYRSALQDNPPNSGMGGTSWPNSR